MKQTPLSRGTKQMKRGVFRKSTQNTPVPKKRKPKSDLKRLKEQLWELCKLITRKRYGNKCYTCSAVDLSGSDYQTGHFISSSICSTELRYDLDNLRVQCSGCNIWKSGNWLEFESRLTREHGPEYVTRLKQKNLQGKGLMYREDWYRHQIAKYQGIYDSLTDV